MLLRLAVAHHSLLDLHGGILKHGQTGTLDGQEDHTSAVGHANARGNIMAPEQLLHRHGFGLGHFQKTGHILKEHIQPFRKRQNCRGSDGTVLQEAVLAAVGRDQAKAGGGVAGVDS